MKIFLYFIITILFVLVCFIYWAKSKSISSLEFPEESIIYYSKAMKTQRPVDPKTLKVVTWNMGYASGDLNNEGAVLGERQMMRHIDDMIKVLKDLDPDIIFLQEIDFKAKRTHNLNQLKFLYKALNMPYNAYRVLWNAKHVPYPYFPIKDQFGPVVSGQAVLSRLPILSQEIQVLDKPPHAFWYNWFYLDRVKHSLRIKWDDEEVALWNVHHEAFHGESRYSQAGILAYDVMKNETKYKIVAGDFNDPTSEKEHGFAGDKFSDTFDHFEKVTKLTSDRQIFTESLPTFPSFQPKDKLDHILASQAFTLKKRRAICSQASDHCLVYVELEKNE